MKNQDNFILCVRMSLIGCVSLMAVYFLGTRDVDSSVKTSEASAVTLEIPVAADNAAAVEDNPVTTNEDGSVIVQDKGASFSMAPSSNERPEFVPDPGLKAGGK